MFKNGRKLENIDEAGDEEMQLDTNIDVRIAADVAVVWIGLARASRSNCNGLSLNLRLLSLSHSPFFSMRVFVCVSACAFNPALSQSYICVRFLYKIAGICMNYREFQQINYLYLRIIALPLAFI